MVKLLLRKTLLFFIVLTPWVVKRFLYSKLFSYHFEEGCHIGLSFIDVKKLTMAKNSKIGNLNVIKGVETVVLGENSIIGNLNWITAFPLGLGSHHFAHQPDRDPSLILGNESAITNRHLIDCTNKVVVGCFVTIAGYGTQILTHSIDLRLNRQNSDSVQIMDFSFVGTRTVILPNSYLPVGSVVSACSVIKGRFSDTYTLYCGNPAIPVKKLDIDSFKYFSRENGFVV